MKTSINKIFLIAVFIFFLVTRLYKIASIPESVYWDEASIGYNAFSIATDLKDEWGDTLPLHFRAFGEFKLPVYIYSTVPFVKILGLNALSVRLPAVLYSLGSVLVIYFFVKKITKNETLGVVSAFILTTNPWFFIFSRTGFEVTAGIFFFLLGTYFATFIEERKLFIFLTALAFLFSFYSYNSFRIVIPIWLVILAIYFIARIEDKRKYLLITILSALMFLASLVPIYRLYKFDTGGLRFAQVEAESPKDFFRNYIKNFSPGFLFINGDVNPRLQIPGQGQLYFIDLPLILLGIYYAAKRRNFWYLTPVIFVIITPISVAITKESPHALRNLLSALSFVIISTFGVKFLSEKIKRRKNHFIVTIGIIYCIFFGSYFTDFATKYQNLSADDWQYQYKEIFSVQEKGIVTDEYAQPYIFALFYQKYPPAEFRKTVKYNPPDKWGFSLVSSFGDFEFR